MSCLRSFSIETRKIFYIPRPPSSRYRISSYSGLRHYAAGLKQA